MAPRSRYRVLGRPLGEHVTSSTCRWSGSVLFVVSAQVVKLCVQVLVEIAQGEENHPVQGASGPIQGTGGPVQGTSGPIQGPELSVEKAEGYRTIAVAVKGMANKLDSELIKVC